jgi:5-methylcytosine-specific restriction enzyme subunit McrC
MTPAPRSSEHRAAGGADGHVPSSQPSIPIRNLWHMLLYAWDRAELLGQWKAEAEQAPTLEALLAEILANLVQQRLRIGIGRDYDSHQQEVAGVRGRVMFSESVRRMSFQKGKAFCGFQVFTPDVPKNQLIRGVLALLVDTGDFGTSSRGRDLRARLRRLVRDLDMVQMVSPTAEDVGRQLQHKHDRDYSLMLTICGFLLRSQMPTEEPGIARSPGIDKSALVLHAIYERFVARFYARHLRDWTVTAQPRWQWWPEGGTSAYLPTMAPDLVLESRTTGRMIVLDTKFTAKVLTPGPWNTPRFRREHLFQIYAYLRSQEHRSVAFQDATGILLYPTVDHAIHERVEVQGHVIRWETVNLADPWQAIEARLLEITT